MQIYQAKMCTEITLLLKIQHLLAEEEGGQLIGGT